MAMQNITEQVSIYKRINYQKCKTKDIENLAIGERVQRILDVSIPPPRKFRLERCLDWRITF